MQYWIYINCIHISCLLLGMILGVLIRQEVARKAGMDAAYEFLDKHAPGWRNE